MTSSSSDLSSRLAVLIRTGTALSRSIFHIISWSGPGLTLPRHSNTSLSFILMPSTSCGCSCMLSCLTAQPQRSILSTEFSREWRASDACCQWLTEFQGDPNKEVKFWRIARDLITVWNLERKLGTRSMVKKWHTMLWWMHIQQEKGRMMQMATAWWPWTWNGRRFLPGHWNSDIRAWSLPNFLYLWAIDIFNWKYGILRVHLSRKKKYF